MNKQKRMEELEELIVQSPEELKKEAEENMQFPSTWKVSNESLGMINHSIEIYNTKHGLYAAVPLMCKGERCPFSEVCPLIDRGDDPTGSRCPIEIGLILRKYEEYKNYFQVEEDDVVDMGLIKDLVDYDIQLHRAENRIAMQADFLEDVVISVTENGQEITAPQISQAANYKEKIQTKKHKVLQLMHSTRSDKAGDKMTITLDPSTYAAQLMSQVAESMKPGQLFDDEE